MSNPSVGQTTQSLPARLDNYQDSVRSKDNLEVTAFRHKVKARNKAFSRLFGFIGKRKTPCKTLNQYSITKAPRQRPQVNLHRVHSQPGLQVLSNNPNLRLNVYQGNPFQVSFPGPIGHTIVLPPGNWQVQQNWQPQTAFPQLGFPAVFRQPAPVQFYQSHQQHVSRGGQRQHLAQPQLHSAKRPQPQRARPATPAHVYQDKAKRLQINQSRVTERFHSPSKSTEQLRQRAADTIELSLSGKLPFNKDVANRKSADYTRLISVLETHQKSSARPLPTGPGELKGGAEARIDNIELGIETINEIERSGRNYFSQTEMQELRQLKFEMRAERALLVQVMDDPVALTLDGKASWQTATELKRTGYPLDSRLLPEFNGQSDDKLVKKPEPFGAGKFHSVVKLNYEGSDRPVIFKAEDAIDTSKYEDLVGKDKYLDKSRPRFAARNLAAGKLQECLGVKLLPEMTLGTHNGKLGLFMSEAKGVKPYNFDTKTAVPLPYDSKGNPQVSANLQKNLTNAQWLDCLAGQEDRHPGNLFVDPATGDVTLIDNDQAFYPGLRSVDDPDPNRRVNNWAPPWPGKPEVIDSEFFDYLQAMTPEQLQSDLGHLLKKTEIEATASRLKDLQQHAFKLQQEGKVIDNWVTWRSPGPKPQSVADFLRGHSKPQSYFSALDRLNPGKASLPRQAESKPKHQPNSTL